MALRLTHIVYLGENTDELNSIMLVFNICVYDQTKKLMPLQGAPKSIIDLLYFLKYF